MNSDNKLIYLGIGASLATAAFCTYKLTSKASKGHRRRRRQKEVKVVDVDGCSQNGLSDVDITIIDGDQSVNGGKDVEKVTEASVPLYMTKQIIKGEDVVTCSSSEITDLVAPKRQKRNLKSNIVKEDRERNSSVDSEEARFQQWQQQREQHLRAKNYVKNDKIYCDENIVAAEDDKRREKRKLDQFIKTYRKDRLRTRSTSNSGGLRIKSHFSEMNHSLTEMCQSEKDSACEVKSGVSKPDSLNQEIEQRNETNFFDIFLAISQPIVEDKKVKQRKKLRKTKRKMKMHSNAFSEPNFIH